MYSWLRFADRELLMAAPNHEELNVSSSHYLLPYKVPKLDIIPSLIVDPHGQHLRKSLSTVVSLL